MSESLKGDEFMVAFREFIEEEKKAKKWRDNAQRRSLALREGKEKERIAKQYRADGYTGHLRRKNRYLKSTKLR